MNGTAAAYDLSTPAPLPREAARRLLAQKETLAEELRIHLRRLLRMRTEVEVAPAEVVRVRHFTSFLDGRAWWYAGGGRAEPGGRTVLLGASPGLVYAGIDRMLGGPGSAGPSGKPPTAIEFQFGMRFLREVFQGFAQAFALAPLHLEVAAHAPLAEPLLTYLPDLEEPFARIACRVRLLDQEHELLICLSRKLLEATEPKPEESTAKVQRITAPVAAAPVELLVELARCRLTVEEAAGLGRGDVVLFDLPPGEPIDVRVQGKPRLKARLGTHEGRYAIEVTEVLDPAPAKADAAVEPPPAKPAAKPAPEPATREPAREPTKVAAKDSATRSAAAGAAPGPQANPRSAPARPATRNS